MTREKEVKKIWNFYYYTYTASSTEHGKRGEEGSLGLFSFAYCLLFSVGSDE
jgi:hypothetical protein